jgi:hypothetical protein
LSSRENESLVPIIYPMRKPYISKKILLKMLVINKRKNKMYTYSWRKINSSVRKKRKVIITRVIIKKIIKTKEKRKVNNKKKI